MSIQQHIDKLGRKAKDKVTGFKGVVSSVSFDLYGCIQAVVTPPATKDGKCEDGRWFDIQRLEIEDSKRVMEVPDYDNGYIAEGRKGPCEKPPR